MDSQSTDITARILVVDDSDLIRELLRDVLTANGFDVEVATDGIDAIQIFSSQSFDLVITDIIMPGEDGIGAIIKMKQAVPDIKIIAISGGGRNRPDTYLELAEKLGAVKTFEKPFDIKDLEDYVNDMFAT